MRTTEQIDRAIEALRTFGMTSAFPDSYTLAELCGDVLIARGMDGEILQVPPKDRFRVEVRYPKHIGPVTRVFRDGVEIEKVYRCEVQQGAVGHFTEISLTFNAVEVVIDDPAFGTGEESETP